MNSVVQYLSTAVDLLLVIIGFGLIIVIHELGHHLAAKWAGIRVLAFAVGFGPAIFSFRKGMGFRRGSTEPEYLKRLADAGYSIHSPPSVLPAISPTEYRLNLFPFGGYVKMLGQVDDDPTATSDAPDSYQNCPPPKRMVVISAGVLANLFTAALIFILVFLVGLKTSPPVVGAVRPGSPARHAVITTDDGKRIEGGILPGDRILSVDGNRTLHFADAETAVAMSARDATVRISLERAGQILTAELKPETGPNGLRTIGLEPLISLRLHSPKRDRDRVELTAQLARAGLDGVAPGWSLTAIEGQARVEGFHMLAHALQAGHPVRAEFSSPDGSQRTTVLLSPRAQLELGVIVPDDRKQPLAVLEHLLGLTPVMTVRDADPPEGPRASSQGLRSGDIFARLGNVEFPNIEQGRREIRAHAGREIPIAVLRRDDTGRLYEVILNNVRVTSDAVLGFYIGDTSSEMTLLSRPPDMLREGTEPGAREFAPAATRLIREPGLEVVHVNDRPVANFTQLRDALADALRGHDADVTLRIALRRPVAGIPAPDGPVETREWTITPDEAQRLLALGWDSPIPPDLFEPETFTLRGNGPLNAISLGLHETHRVMMMTYLTFKRLTVDRTVKVEHLKGPVGIAHIGTTIAGRGLIWLLFFLALISVNLAVINFLPLPIVDGGQFLFLVYEWIRGRPAPAGLQTTLTYLGLALIACVFIVVTFHDVRRLFGL